MPPVETLTAIRPTPLPHTPHAAVIRPPVAANDARMGTVVAGGDKIREGEVRAPEALNPKDQAQQKRFDSLNKWSGRFEMPLMLEGLGFMVGGVLAWVAGAVKLPRVRTVIQSALQAPVQALRETRLNDLMHLPANYMHSVAQFASQNGPKAEKMAAGAATRAETMASKAAERSTALATKTSGARTAVGNAIDGFAKTSVGGKLEEWLGGNAAKRLERVSAKHNKIMAKTIAATTTEHVGFFGSIKNFFTNTKPATGLDVPGELKGVVAKLHAAHGLTDTKARAEGFAEAAKELQKVTQASKLEGQAAGVAGKLMGQLEKATNSAFAVHSYSNAANGSLRNVAKAAVQSVGRVPLFGALVGVGVAFGIGAKVVGHNIEKKHAQATVDAVVQAAGGDNNNAYIQNVFKVQRGEGLNRAARTAAGVANEGFNAVWGLVPHGGGPAMMAGQMVPQAVEMMLHGDPYFAAFESKQKAERGEIQLAPEDELKAYKELVARHPSVPANEGIYNHMVGPVARAMQAKQMTAADVVGLLADGPRFDAFLKNMQAEQLAAEKANTANDNELGHVNSTPDIGPKASAEARYAATEKPSIAGIGAGADKAHAGMLAEHQRALG